MNPLPDKKYGIIYADPPWSYRVWTAKGGHKSASAHYQTSSTKDIATLPISNIADENCALFLWATYPNLKDAINVMESWGFTYKTVAFTWIKTYKNGNPFVGLGYWTRANAEICLLGTKGHPKRIDKGVRQVVISEKREHSRKPDEVRDRIVKLMGSSIPKIELFARQTFGDWDCWGNETTLYNTEKVNG